MKSKLTFLALLITTITFGQSGINYKALIKDTNGNIVNNQIIDMVFTIEIGGISSYSESHQFATDDNGIAITTIGTGAVISGDFNSIDWNSGNAKLNVQINFGNGLIDFGNSDFNTVPYAINTLKPQGLEAIDEGNGIGFRLAGRDPNLHHNVGLNAIDLSLSTGSFGPRGAAGNNSVALGQDNNVYGNSSIAIGFESTVNGNSSAVIGSNSFVGGNSSLAVGFRANASGNISVSTGNETQALGNISTSMGSFTRAQAFNSVAIGRYNVGLGDTETWNSFDPLFEIGNGTSGNNRSNALTVYKNGRHVIRSSSTGISIIESSTGITISNPSSNGISIQDPNINGIEITSPNENGISISNATENGIVASADNHGARFFGDNAGIYASGGGILGDAPDIILGSSSSEPFPDDGIISTNPLRSSSDMFLRSYDAVIVQLDYDNNETGNFRIQNGANNTIFNVNESGDVEISGFLSIGTETIEDTGSNQLTVDASLIPNTNNAFRLGNSDSRWIGVWATDGTINTSDRREKKNIKDLDYGLAEVLKMQPVSFNWKSKSNPDTKLGLIAQDLLELIPEVVMSHEWKATSDDENAPLEKVELDRLGVYYSDLIPVLINAIKEQQKIIEGQNEALKISKNNYEALLSRIEQLEANSTN